MSNEMCVNETGFCSDWSGTLQTNVKTMQDLIDEGKMSNPVIIDEIDSETGKLLLIELYNSNSEIEKLLLAKLHKSNPDTVKLHKSNPDTVKLKMDLSDVADKQKRWILKHIAHNQVLGVNWADGTVHEFPLEMVDAPSVKAHMQDFNLILIEDN